MRLTPSPEPGSSDTAPPEALDDRILAAARLVLPPGLVLTPNPAVAAALRGTGSEVVVADISGAPAAQADGVVLLADELSSTGEHAESLINGAVAAVRPGGWLIASARSHLAPSGGGRTYRSDQLRGALGHAGVAVEALWAPGAAALVRGDPTGGFDAEADRLPGLADAAMRLVAAGRVARSETHRSATFFATLPYKVVAASVVCRDEQGRLLVVHDTFKQSWTLPGGVVDADEDPKSAAEREAWEEAGVRVRAGAILGVFSASWPDRVVLVYEASPIPGADHRHAPVHAHEIGEVAWWPLDVALRRLAPYVAEQVRTSLQRPGSTLRQGRA